MLIRSVHDRDELAGLLCRDPVRRAYELGDLDDFFWPYTTWYRNDDSVALIYHGAGLPILLALDTPDRTDQLAALLAGLAPLLPRRFYAHLSPGVEGVLEKYFDADSHGPHLKMALTDPSRLDADPSRPDGSPAHPNGEAPDTELLTPADLPELSALYALAYPGNAFDGRMLETGQYIGVRRSGALVAVAGVHTWSPTHRVAALGNVTTHPDLRRRGLARAAVVALCHRLRSDVEHITLNVKADNAAAVALYSRLGFTPAGDYLEITCTARR